MSFKNDTQNRDKYRAGGNFVIKFESLVVRMIFQGHIVAVAIALRCRFSYT